MYLRAPGFDKTISSSQSAVTCLSWVGPPSNLGGGECARCVPSSQPSSSCPSTTTPAAPMAPSFALLATSAFPRCRKRPSARTASASPRPEQRFPPLKILRETAQREILHLSPTRPQCTRTPWRTGVMGLPLPLATCLSWVGPPSNLGMGECARCVPSSQS